MGNEILSVSALENEDLDGLIRLRLVQQGDQIPNEFGSQEVHGRSRNLRKQHCTFPADRECREVHGMCAPIPLGGWCSLQVILEDSGAVWFPRGGTGRRHLRSLRPTSL